MSIISTWSSLRAAEVDEQVQFSRQRFVVSEARRSGRESQETDQAHLRPFPQGPDEQRRHHEQLRINADVMSVRQTLKIMSPIR